VNKLEKLINIAKVVRSKNAGPLYITFDLIFADAETFRAVSNARVLTPELIARLYEANESDVAIFEYGIVNSIKITIPRKYVSGSIYDTDIYGCGQHMPLANVTIPMGGGTIHD